MQLQFYWDAVGDPRAHCDPPGRPLAEFLESDIQGSTATAREVLRALDWIEAGDRDHWEMTGNIHTLALSPEGASLQNEHEEDSEPYELPLSQFRQALTDWVSFLEEGRGS
ncbi:MAG TPA: YacL family protein [Thermoanaerobaculia bacterium]|nr:YacL family protein [Thermoanaerobaculia bacterium]